MVQDDQASARMARVLDLLFETPVVTVRQVETRLGLIYSTAQRYVRRLEELGILREITGRARNRVFRADGIIQAIESP